SSGAAHQGKGHRRALPPGSGGPHLRHRARSAGRARAAHRQEAGDARPRELPPGTAGDVRYRREITQGVSMLASVLLLATTLGSAEPVVPITVSEALLKCARMTYASSEKAFE